MVGGNPRAVNFAEIPSHALQESKPAWTGFELTATIKCNTNVIQMYYEFAAGGKTKVVESNEMYHTVHHTFLHRL